MNTPHPIQSIVSARKQGRQTGIYSCCSANPFVIKAALQWGKKHHTPVLIEATANQVDQYGGYSGMNPQDFHDFVRRIAKDCDAASSDTDSSNIASSGIDSFGIILGGDHLGPLTFAHLPEAQAMREAAELIRQYVAAGFTKIHLDTSMRLADDDAQSMLHDETIARRGAALCRVAEDAYYERLRQHPHAQAPIYVIGSEVPIPGGAREDEGIHITSAEDCRKTIDAFRQAFCKEGLSDAWQRVAGVVVQPGVEFSDAQVCPYNRERARALTAVIEEYDSIVFEGHSTDYQTKHALREMVEDGIAILKVGPALTFALREGLLALEAMEKELLTGKGIWMSELRNTLEAAMLDHPTYWAGHYHGSGTSQRFARIFSYSDRSRYYLGVPAVQASISRLISNLEETHIPHTLLSQYMPVQHIRVAKGELPCTPEPLLLDKVGDCIADYLYATNVISQTE